ncbi:MAG: hypothetical protein AAF583_01475 [Pseudomonadota bacterium]
MTSALDDLSFAIRKLEAITGRKYETMAQTQLSILSNVPDRDMMAEVRADLAEFNKNHPIQGRS